jgi:cyclopropane fatty-acyl-phospholipid synthase-like methyltransferase
MAKKKPKKARGIPSRHDLYEASVQSVDADLDFFERVYRRKRGQRFTTFREDFCGTAVLSCEWVRRRKENRAWGVDLHVPTLEWGRKNRLTTLGDDAERVTLINANVLDVEEPKVDVVAALNFSFSVFKKRELLRTYFETVRRSLAPGGIFFVDNLGGSETMGEVTDKRRIPATTLFNGHKTPAFTYIWDQARFNAVNHDLLCYIHFDLAGGVKVRRAFTYDWRLWTLPELQELMREAGFASAEVYLEGWDDEEDDTDGVFRRRVYFENQEAWVAYVVGIT